MGRATDIGKRIAAMIGALSILFLSAVLPWRAASCAALNAGGEQFSQIICKADAASGHSQIIMSPGAPAPEHPDCSICLGLAGLALAIVAVTLVGLVLGRFSHTVHVLRALCLHGVEGLLRSSRAPPLAA